MKQRKFLQYGLPLLALAVALGYFAPDLSRWVEGQIEQRRKAQKKSELLPTGAVVLSSEGPVAVVAPSPIGRQPLGPTVSQLPLLQGYVLETGPRSRVQVKARSGTLEVGDYSQIQFELWNPADPGSPLYILLHRGQLRVTEESRPGEVFILQGGRLSALNLSFNDQDLERRQRLRQLKTDPQALEELRGMSLDEGPEKTPVEELAETSLEDVPAEISLESEALRVTTLSNSYIDDVIASQRRGFQRCQANNLRDGLPSRGEMVFGIRISPRGQIDEIKTLKNTIGDETLENCVRSVFERLRFRNFEGPPIERSYPLNFE